MERDGYVVTSSATYSADEGFLTRSYQHSGTDLPRARDYPHPNDFEDC